MPKTSLLLVLFIEEFFFSALCGRGFTEVYQIIDRAGEISKPWCRFFSGEKNPAMCCSSKREKTRVPKLDATPHTFRVSLTVDSQSYRTLPP